MDADFFRTLYDHSYWARDRVLAAIAGMSEAEFARPNGFTYRSVRGILRHTLWAEAMWLQRWQRLDPEPIPEEAVATPETLAKRWYLEEAKMRAYLAALADTDLSADVALIRRNGTDLLLPRWELLTQVALHSVQHRSEAAEALTMVGRSPGDLDISQYFRELRGI
jgi:uncharacterized damage-inducible protein DinB